MEINYIKDRLEKNVLIFQSSFSGIEEIQYNWKPADLEIWSLKEILCHLLDEERYDFRPRIQSVLDQVPPPPIDPESWVSNYKDRSYEKDFNDLISERRKSIEFIMGLDINQWESLYHHQASDIKRTCKFYLENWLAHDLLHIRQATKLHYLYISARAQNKLEYAGKWVL